MDLRSAARRLAGWVGEDVEDFAGDEKRLFLAGEIGVK